MSRGISAWDLGMLDSRARLLVRRRHEQTYATCVHCRAVHRAVHRTLQGDPHGALHGALPRVVRDARVAVGSRAYAALTPQTAQQRMRAPRPPMFRTWPQRVGSQKWYGVAKGGLIWVLITPGRRKRDTKAHPIGELRLGFV